VATAMTAAGRAQEAIQTPGRRVAPPARRGPARSDDPARTRSGCVRQAARSLTIAEVQLFESATVRCLRAHKLTSPMDPRDPWARTRPRAAVPQRRPVFSTAAWRPSWRPTAAG
jgi:hypothetical protein